MAPIRRVTLDLLKPYDPSLVSLAQRVADVDSVAGVDVTLLESDREVQNVKLTVEGDDVDFAAIERTVEAEAGSVHSVDQVACGARVVEERPTPQD